MTDTTTPSVCPNCQHPHHLPGTECSTPVHHGPSHWHRCLCLARPGAALSCPPQMTCQGGTLGYADIWYLQHGHVLVGEDGTIAPGVFETGVASVGFPSGPDIAAAAPASVVVPAADRAADVDPVRCPLCPDARILDTPAQARNHFATVHPEQRLVGSGPWPLLANREQPADRAALRDRIADGQGEPAELRDLPREVRRLVHAVDRMRGDWAESSDERRAELWRTLHDASDAVWNRPLSVLPAPADRAAEELAKRVTRAIFALKSPAPPGSEHYRAGWDDGLEAAMDAARDAVVDRVAAETPPAETLDDDEGLRAKVDDATSTLRRIRSAIRTLKEQGATGRTYHQVITNALAGPRPDEVPEPETEADIVREHVTTVHLIGEQLTHVESWLWKRLAEVRAELPAVVARPGKDTETPQPKEA
ncbi:hypothetical protein [Streptomyces scabiei]|uniref:hypothetical protein n=1 Tax=Streptomyces scabiei TaxID=1930 RepID=UPI0029A22B80|nr:hypothetical protein [Streptomyces scabiei]MDX3034954.1 hypothetical protein [Streptomyces scabiei]